MIHTSSATIENITVAIGMSYEMLVDPFECEL